MTARTLRAALTAILLGTAAAAATVTLVAPAQAAVSFKVGGVLKEAQSLAAAGNYKGAMAKISEAKAIPGRTAEDNDVISKMENYIAVKSGDASIGGAAGAKAKFANDYNAGKFRDVIADGEQLKKLNALDAQSALIVGQAYYKANDYAGCVRYLKTIAQSDTALELQARCAYEVGDEATQRAAFEQLVARSGKPEYWKGLLKLGERSRGLSDHNTLDINRIRALTGTLETKEEYTLLAQLALQLGNAAEAQSYIEKGVAAKVLADDRSQKLLALAKQQAATNLAKEPATIAAAKAAPQGDDLVKAGENMIGEGKAKDAIPLIQEGLKKPLKDQANGQIRLGQAYLAAGQKAEAKAAFSKVKTPEKDAMVAHLWFLAASR